jgi:hypothetical protein
VGALRGGELADADYPDAALADVRRSSAGPARQLGEPEGEPGLIQRVKDAAES